jgi:hypothetical protein
MPIFTSGNNHVENEQLVNDTGKNIMKMINNQKFENHMINVH